LIDEDLTRADGAIRCRRISEVEALNVARAALRLTRILTRLPLPA